MKIDLEPNENIEPCPFCGSGASLHTTPIGANQKGGQVTPQTYLYWVRCDDAVCGTTQTAVSDQSNALARWNRRA